MSVVIEVVQWKCATCGSTDPFSATKTCAVCQDAAQHLLRAAEILEGNVMVNHTAIATRRVSPTKRP